MYPPPPCDFPKNTGVMLPLPAYISLSMPPCCRTQLLLHLPYEQAALEAPALAHRLALSNSVCARGACCALVAQTYSVPPLPRQLQFRVRGTASRGQGTKSLTIFLILVQPPLFVPPPNPFLVVNFLLLSSCSLQRRCLFFPPISFSLPLFFCSVAMGSVFFVDACFLRSLVFSSLLPVLCWGVGFLPGYCSIPALQRTKRLIPKNDAAGTVSSREHRASLMWLPFHR